MIRKDFLRGGFPVNNRAPVLCITEGGNILVAHNNFDLKKIIDKEKIRRMLGVWPGRMHTDLFVLEPGSYGKIVPPEAYKDIDSADSITVEYAKGNVFRAVLYSVADSAIVTCTDRRMEDYLKVCGRKYLTRYAK